MKRAFKTLPLILVALLIFCTSFIDAKENNNKKIGPLSKVAIKGDNTVFDVNNIRTYIRNNGSFNRDPGTGNAGFEWPKGSENTAIYASGIWIGAKTHDTVRVAIAEYSYEYTAGPIAVGVNPQDSKYKMYKVNRGDDALKNPDYASWPFDDGAPAVRNYNNTADSLDEHGSRIPLILGDMAVFAIFNDNDPSVHNNQKTPPLGIEVQLYAFGFSRSDALGDAIFYKWRLLNKGGRNLDSMYVCIWSDCDIGGGAADYDGCDTTLGLGYTYSGAANNTEYGSTPPAAGFDFLQGPIVPSPGETVYLPDGTIIPDYKLMKMTSYIFYNNDISDWGNPMTGQEVYNYFQAKSRTGKDTTDPAGNVSKFMFSGDPNLPNGPTNWIEIGTPGDRRFMMSAGPFTMSSGDQQLIVGGNMIARGADNRSSVTALKKADELVQLAYDLNFKLAPPPPSPKVEVTKVKNGVVLFWGKDVRYADSTESFWNVDPIAAKKIVDSIYNFEGYVVYQFENGSGANPKVIAIYDKVNGVKAILDSVFDSNIGSYVWRNVKEGKDAGIQRVIRLTADAYTGQPLIDDKNYYYAVTSYSYNPMSIPRTNESPFNIITVRPRLSTMGTSFSSIGLDTIKIEHTSGISNAEILPIAIQPDSIIGDTYEVRFKSDGSGGLLWDLVDVTKGIVLDSNLTNFSGDYQSPVRDGIQFKVIDAPADLDYIAITPSDTSQEWFTGWSTYGFNYFGGGIELGTNAYDWIYYGWHPTLPFGSYKEVEVRLDASNLGWAYRYRRLGDPDGPGGYRMVFQDMVQLPVQAWDVTDAFHPRRINVAFRDQVVDGNWDPWHGDATVGGGPFELMAICNSDYDSTGTYYNTPLVPGGPFESDAMYVLSLKLKASHTEYERPNVLTIKPFYILTSSDLYSINTANYKATPGKVDVAKTQIDRINAVPNPYFAANAYERDQFNKVMRFTNLPAVAKIRIFNLVGELVNVLDKNDPTTTSIDWNLTNRNSLPVASGMYIVHIDMGAIGTKVLKVAVIMAEERLDNF